MSENAGATPGLPGSDLEADPAERCRHLRSKMMHVASDWNERAALYPSTTASYWCLRTMASVGPDDGLADLPACRKGRDCYSEGD